jgi:hypothetical protein
MPAVVLLIWLEQRLCEIELLWVILLLNDVALVLLSISLVIFMLRYVVNLFCDICKFHSASDIFFVYAISQRLLSICISKSTTLSVNFSQSAVFVMLFPDVFLLDCC